MIVDVLAVLGSRRIVLASQSPRRAQLLRQVGLTAFDVVPSTFAEDLPKASFATPVDYVAETALRKCQEVAARVGGDAIVISADTIVVVDDAILEKPRDAEDAKRMLARLSGRSHAVYTAVTVADVAAGAARWRRVRSFVERTDVDFAVLTPSAIDAYVGTGEPLDKAGGYGIQAGGAQFVTGIRGCYFNVAGLPLQRVCAELRALVTAE